MATRLYFSSDDTAVYDPVTRRGAWDKTSGATVHRLAATRTGRGFGATNTENVATANYDVLLSTFVSDPLLANTTIAGTLDAIVLAAESNADADDTLHLHVWVTQGDSATARGTLLTDYIDATEWAVSSGVTAFTAVTMPQQTLTSVAAIAGDRIVVEVGYRAANSHSTLRTGGIVVGGRSGTDATGAESAVAANTNNVPWVEFSTTLSFAPTYLYTVNAAAPATPGAVLGTWDVDGKTDQALARTKAGSSSNRTVAETSTTNPTDALNLRSISDELAAQTIGAVACDILLRQYQSAADADAFPKIHLYVMQADGTARGTLLANTVGGTELDATASPPVRRVSVTLSSLAVLAGDRLVLEAGARFTNVTATSKTTTIAVGETECDTGVGPLGPTAANSTAQSGWIRIAQRLLWLADAPAAVARSQAIVVA